MGKGRQCNIEWNIEHSKASLKGLGLVENNGFSRREEDSGDKVGSCRTGKGSAHNSTSQQMGAVMPPSMFSVSEHGARTKKTFYKYLINKVFLYADNGRTLRHTLRHPSGHMPRHLIIISQVWNTNKIQNSC